MSSPIVEYVRRGLTKCYMPSKQSWSYIYHLDGRFTPNESVPYYDTYYSLNVILGLAALKDRSWETEYDGRGLLQQLAKRMFEHKSPTYGLGMALWAAAQLDEPLASPTAAKISAFVKNRSNWMNFRAQDTGIILTGIAEQKGRGNSDYDKEAHDLFRFIKESYLTPSKLFFDQPRGFRRNFASFATHTYLTTALYHYGLRYGSEEALELADASVVKLISLQGPNGEWPWFYFAPKGIVIDNYEVYSVHQDGMAPLFLTFAEQRGVPGACSAILKGFEWIFGKNQLGKSMLVPELGMFYRSIIRKGELDDKKKRMMRAVVNGVMGRSDRYTVPDTLMLRPECRSYHLGWILYSFGNRTDMPEITHNPAFST